MIYRSALTSLACLALAAACGSTPPPHDTSPTEAVDSPTGAVDPAASSRGNAVPSRPGEAGRHLSIRADGPDPVSDRTPATGDTAYRATFVVTNESIVATDIEGAEVTVKVRRGGRVLDCSEPSLVAPSPRLAPGESHRVTVASVCPHPAAGEYEVSAQLRVVARETLVDLPILHEHASVARVHVEG